MKPKIYLLPLFIFVVACLVGCGNETSTSTTDETPDSSASGMDDIPVGSFMIEGGDDDPEVFLFEMEGEELELKGDAYVEAQQIADQKIVGLQFDLNFYPVKEMTLDEVFAMENELEVIFNEKVMKLPQIGWSMDEEQIVGKLAPGFRLSGEDHVLGKNPPNEFEVRIRVNGKETAPIRVNTEKRGVYPVK